MKTEKKLAKELYQDYVHKSEGLQTVVRSLNQMNIIKRTAFCEGYKEAMRWRNPKDELPPVYNGSGDYENKDLFIIKWNTHGSFEFAVLIHLNGRLTWDIPDKGFAELYEVDGWRPIE